MPDSCTSASSSEWTSGKIRLLKDNPESQTRLAVVTDSTTTTWTPAYNRRRTWFEIFLVLGISLGESAVYSVVAIIRRLSQTEALSEQTATINKPLADQPIFDLIYQLLSVGFSLVPVLLVFWLLAKPGLSGATQIGFNLREPGRDLARGFGLAALIGIPGIAFYLLGHALGITVTIVPTALDTNWWTVPVLLLAAARAALEEEIIVVGYLFTRLRELGWVTWRIITASAILRGSYHLYQGFGPFLGNVVMGILFGMAYQRWGRTMPLVIAHFILDVISFVGYSVVKAVLPGFLPGT